VPKDVSSPISFGRVIRNRPEFNLKTMGFLSLRVDECESIDEQLLFSRTSRCRSVKRAGRFDPLDALGVWCGNGVLLEG
jgi:hypothetical protein